MWTPSPPRRSQGVYVVFGPEMRPRKSLFPFGSLALACALLGGCDAAGTRVHVATATPEELRAASEDDIVWYEFREGDELPFEFGLFGDAAAIGEPTTLIARRQFWLILSRDRQIKISYDGKTSTMDEMEFLLTVVPGDDGKARLVWLNHLGTGDAEEALRDIMGPAKSEAP